MRERSIVFGAAALLATVLAYGHLQGGRGHLVGVDELAGLLDRGEAIVVDVRTSREYAAGHVPGALNVPYDRAAERASEVAALARGRMVVLYCRSGSRARIAEPAFAAGGVTEIHHLDGQIAAWARSGRPVETGL